MWRSREDEVTCIACGTGVSRSEAREYDKHGDRWERRGKEFEHLCKDCYGELCHQPRDGLESALIDAADTDPTDQESFVAAYTRQAMDSEQNEPADRREDSSE